jgi:radical SAM protein with 4Fe4S-binding SPASM domain
MGAADYIVLAIIVAVIGGAAFYIYKAKKAGQKCIGCPHSKNCSGGCSCSSKK